MDILFAVNKLYGDCHQDEQDIIYIGNTSITDEQLNAATVLAKELQAEYDANQYQRDRALEYPSIEDQLDDLFHNGIEGWKASIQAVKDKYPKGV